MQKYNNPRWRALGTGRHIGLELELVHPDGPDVLDTLEDIREITPSYIAVAKLDGSVSGVEFVTNPASFAVHRGNLTAVLQDMRGKGFSAARSCGLHIHIERRPDESNADLVVKKLVTLLNQSSEPWDTLLRGIYGRGGRHWARTVSPRTGKFSADLSQSYGSSFEHGLDDKFLRLNVLHNNTLEFRQGAGTANKRRILMRIEASLALVRFARYVSVDKLDSAENHEGEVSLFKRWVKARATKYRRLAEMFTLDEEALLAD